MKAVLIEAFQPFGDKDALPVREIAVPEPGPHEVRLTVHAAGLNFADTLMVAGKYQVKPSLPFSPGMEVAGVVSSVGKEVSGIALGDRMMSMCGWGAFAEEVCVPAAMAFPVPAQVGLDVAAIFPITYGTTYHALVDRAELRHDEWMVVHGAGSGVGLNAVELGRLMGARVIAVAGSESKLEAARLYGAYDLIDSRSANIRDRVLQLTGGKGADVIFDPVGGEVFEGALRYVSPQGRLLVLGFASGTIPVIKANLVLLKGCQIVGVNTALFIRDSLPEYRRRFEMMMRWVADGRLRPLVGSHYDLEGVGRAMSDLTSRKVKGKAVITPARSDKHT